MWWVALVVIFGLAAVREALDPYLVLFLDDWVRPKPAPLTLAMSETISVRLYDDTRPHIGKIAALQKGLVLVRDGREVIEEGYGFGLPLIQWGDLVYNARHAETLALGESTLVKRYTVNVADRWSRFLRVKYKDVPSLGTVTVTYTVLSPQALQVEVDFTELHVDWSTAYLMNEQGAVHFPIYRDSQGRERHGDEIGIWHPDDDPLGCWVAHDGGLSFCAETEPGRQRYVGREHYKQYNWVRIYALSWSGIDLVVQAPAERYSYVIHIQEADDGR
jgi:hypothetical protein